MISSAIYAKLKREINLVLTQRSISSSIQNAQILSLSYFQTYIKKELHIFSSITSLCERIVSSEEDTILEYFLSARINVKINITALQLNIIFESDSEVFRSER